MSTPTSTPINTDNNNSNSTSGIPRNDYSNMFLVSSFLTSNENYLQWKFSIQIALGAKKKLGYIDGTTSRPESGENEIADWIITDCMV
ncbi:hypothetical protein LXL04_007854 [Taraxacum kok-saghyz]